MNGAERQELWERLEAAALVHGELPPAVASPTPWFVRVMLGIAGWIGALFLLAFIGIGFHSLIESWPGAIITGTLLCAGAAMLFRSGLRADFASQFALALSFAGQALICFGISELLRWDFFAVCLAMTAVETFLFFAVPNFLHRVWSAWAGSFALTLAFWDLKLDTFAPGIVTAGFAFIWFSEFRHPRRGALLRAGGYGLAASIVATVIMLSGRSEGVLWWSRAVQAPGNDLLAWLGLGLSGTVLIGVSIRLLLWENVPIGSRQGKAVLAGAGILAAASLKAPGLGPCVAILVVGHAAGNRRLAGLGILALLGYLAHYYYVLDATLLQKSEVLAGVGLSLLIARLVLLKCLPAPESAEEAAHA